MEHWRESLILNKLKLNAVLLFLSFTGVLLSLQTTASLQNSVHQLMGYPRVKQAYGEKTPFLKQTFKKKELHFPPKKIFIRIFKQEKILELWVNLPDKVKFALLKQYKICATSGTPGPKRQEGDMQVPEGFYFIDRFNPASNFFLSLGLNYPNESDKILGVKDKLGGDIFIHGGCASIGCAAMTDDKIKEIYVLAVEAKLQGQNKIPVHIFPAKLNANGITWLKNEFPDSKTLQTFWMNLKQGYDYFEKYRRLPKVKVDKNGKYIYSQFHIPIYDFPKGFHRMIHKSVYFC